MSPDKPIASVIARSAYHIYLSSITIDRSAAIKNDDSVMIPNIFSRGRFNFKLITRAGRKAQTGTEKARFGRVISKIAYERFALQTRTSLEIRLTMLPTESVFLDPQRS
jgi:hypothetical protein